MAKQVDELDVILSIKSPLELINSLRDEYSMDNRNEVLKFQLACALSKSTKENMLEAVRYFKYFISKNINVRESLYNLTMTKYALNDYESARSYCEDLYRQEPDNKQFQQLHLAISFQHAKQMKQDKENETALGVALGVGIATLAVGIGILLTSRRRK